jgi:hypothetical protein
MSKKLWDFEALRTSVKTDMFTGLIAIVEKYMGLSWKSLDWNRICKNVRVFMKKCWDLNIIYENFSSLNVKIEDLGS